MINSKLIKLYQTLTRVEVRRFKKWLNSPAHNQHSNVLDLFLFIDSRSVFNDKTLAKERVFRSLYKNKKYKEHQLNHIISYAYQTLLEFIGYNRLILMENKLKYTQIQALRERQLPNIAQQLLNNSQNTLEKQPLRNGSYYLHQFELEEEQMYLKTLSNRNASNNLPAIFQSLSNFFMITTLRYACVALSHKQVHKTDYVIPFIDAVIKEIEALEDENPSVLSIYYCAYMALKYPEKINYFSELKQIFFAFASKMDKKEQREVLLMAINYCIRSLNQQKDIEAGAEALELYRYGLEQEILIEQGVLSKFAFNNMVSLGLKEQAFDWVEVFIQNYGQFLEKKYQKSHIHYNTAKLFFAQEHYEKALELLIYVEYDDILMNVDAKVMLVKIYYKYEYYDALDALLNSFTVFLQRKSMLSYHRENYIHFIQFTKRLLALPIYDKKGQKQLEKAIRDTNPLTERAWLLNKLEL